MTDKLSWSIYALVDPRNEEVRYIGFTTQKLRSRLTAHLYQAKKPNGRQIYLGNWLRQLLLLNHIPRIILIDKGMGESWKTTEQNWISAYKSVGAKLTNCSKGGEGPLGCKRSPEFIAELKKRALARYPARAAELIEAARQAITGVKHTPDRIARTVATARAAKLRDPGINVGERNGRAKLTWSDVERIRQRFKDIGGIPGQPLPHGKTAALAREMGISAGRLWFIVHEHQWKRGEVC